MVYKIDRLSRSMLDFLNLVELFESHGVTFVSVTQSFNTKDAMGRMALNILVTFAQFERELIGERIRDKVAASRKRGKWMGGWTPLGYEVRDRKLLIHEADAERVRAIFRRFVQLKSATLLARELVAANERKRYGHLLDKGVLYKILQQPGLPWGGGSQRHLIPRRARADHRSQALGSSPHHSQGKPAQTRRQCSRADPCPPERLALRT